MLHAPTGSDSEDDADYIPAGELTAVENSSDEEEPDVKRIRTSSPAPPDLDEAEKKKARDELWSSFQSSITDKPQPQEQLKEMVKIEKRFKFAGEEVVEVVEVPKDSDEAKKWPLWTPEIAETSTPKAAETSKKPAPSRPGPRKSKLALSALPSASSQKLKKLTTLDKSAMDWRSHLSMADTSVKDELEANRRGGGYIEKVEFLDRVEERKSNAVDANKRTKRRRA